MKIIHSTKPKDKQIINKRRKSERGWQDWKKIITHYFKIGFYIILTICMLKISWQIYQFLWNSSYFNLINIEINQTEYISRDEIIMESGILPRTNLLQISTAEIEENINQLPWVKSVQVIKRFPSDLKINIIERTPIALLVGGRIRGIDNYGYLLEGIRQEAAKNLPLITINENYILNQTRRMETTEIKLAIGIIKKLEKEYPELYSHLSEINITKPDNILIYILPEGTEIRMGNENLSKRLNTLYYVWQMAKGKNIVYEYIDLRFEQQGVITKPKSDNNQKITPGLRI